MLELCLLRHAKAVESAPGLDDLERPLAARGHDASAAIGRQTADAPPDLVLCSPALRTRQTLADIAAHWVREPPMLFDAELYNAPPDALLNRIRHVEDGVARLWVVGHNPGLHELARMLAAHASRADADARPLRHFPTAARAVFTSSADSWNRFGSGEPLALTALII